MYLPIESLKNNTNIYHEGIIKPIAGSRKSVLPPQAIPKRKKNKAWEKACLDNLEREGVKQYVENLPMKDYYDMLSGDMVYADVMGEEVDMLYKMVNKTKKELGIPNYVRHHDLMYPVVQKFVGDWLMNSIKLRFDSVDEVSTNDFIRERTMRLEKYTKALLQQGLNKMLVANGFDVTGNFQSQEEQQAFEQEQQRILQEYYPESVDEDMRKNWKTDFAVWAENTYNRDHFRFNMSHLYMLEAINILLVGKSPRHYRIGYDFYTPEYWHPIETFHSKEASVSRFEDCEFAGRIRYYTMSELMNTYGDRMSEKDRKSIYKAYYGENYTEFTDFDKKPSWNGRFLNESHFTKKYVPFKGYTEHTQVLDLEAATGIPFSQEKNLETGEVKPVFSMPLHNTNLSVGSNLANNLRSDFEVRTDTLQVTEAYWRGSKKIGVLTYRTLTGHLTTVEVDEDILSDVIEEYNIKNLRSTSLVEYELLKEDEKENTIIWVDAPIVYRGVKINCSGLSEVEDIYIVEELPFTIKGEKGNLFDVKLPVCGHIGDSFCKKIRGEQIEYNYLLNQNQAYREREIGSFFIFDVNGAPDDLLDLPDGKRKITSLINIAKSTGLLPLDMSRNNLNQNGGGLPFNPNGLVKLSFTDEIIRNEEMAQRVKWRAYEKIGLTPQALGSVSQYATVEGIQQGQRATLSQTYSIEKIFLDNYSLNAEIHISVAQYCQLNKKDANHIYMAGDNELRFLNSIKDDDLSIRQIAVKPLMDPAKLREFKELKQYLIQMNTVGGDQKTFTELYLADETMELRSAVDRARKYVEKMQQQQQQHEKEMQQAEIQAQNERFDKELEVKRGRNEATVESAYLRSLGQAAARSNENDGMKIIEREFNQEVRTKEIDNKHQLNLQKLQADIDEKRNAFLMKQKELELKNRELDLKQQQVDTRNKEIETKKYTSIVNKN